MDPMSKKSPPPPGGGMPPMMPPMMGGGLPAMPDGPPMPGQGVDPMMAMSGALGPFGAPPVSGPGGLPFGASMPPGGMPPGVSSPILQALLGGGALPQSGEPEGDEMNIETLLALLELMGMGQPPAGSGVPMAPDTTGAALGF